MGKDFATSVLRASFFRRRAHGLDSREHQINYAENPDNSTLSQEHVEISGRALPEMVGMLFKEQTCGSPPLGTEHP
jgi:hypothetical protein